MNQKVSVDLRKNKQWFQEQCKNCADIKFQTFHLGREGQVECFAVYLEIAVSNMMLEESMLGRMMMHLNNVSREELREILRKNELGISDAYPLATLQEAMAAMLAGNLILLIDGYDHIMKIGSKGYPKRAVSIANSEKVLRGSNEAFGETVKENAALIRKRIRSTGLKIEELQMGVLKKQILHNHSTKFRFIDSRALPPRFCSRFENQGP